LGATFSIKGRKKVKLGGKILHKFERELFEREFFSSLPALSQPFFFLSRSFMTVPFAVKLAMPCC
jgi:hypothetical protein